MDVLMSQAVFAPYPNSNEKFHSAPHDSTAAFVPPAFAQQESPPDPFGSLGSV